MPSDLIDHPQNRKSSTGHSIYRVGAGSYVGFGAICNVGRSIPTAMQQGGFGKMVTIAPVGSHRTFRLHKVKLPPSRPLSVPAIFAESEEEMRYGASAYVGEAADRVLAGMDEATAPEYPPLPRAE